MDLTKLGGVTKTTIFKIELDKLSEAFPAPLKKGTVTFSADLITGNKVNISVNGSAISEVTFATSHDATMTAIVTALSLLPTVASASASGRVIYITPTNQEYPVNINNAYVTGGASVPTTVTAAVDNQVIQGIPVKFDAVGDLVPAAAGDAPHVIIGNALQTQNQHSQAEITVIMKSHLTVIAKASGNIVAGPVKYAGFDTTDGRQKYSGSSVTASNIAGWALESVSGGEEVRVAVIN